MCRVSQSGEFAVQLASREAELEAAMQELAEYRSDYEVSLVTRKIRIL